MQSHITMLDVQVMRVMTGTERGDLSEIALHHTNLYY